MDVIACSTNKAISRTTGYEFTRFICRTILYIKMSIVHHVRHETMAQTFRTNNLTIQSVTHVPSPRNCRQEQTMRQANDCISNCKHDLHFVGHYNLQAPFHLVYPRKKFVRCRRDSFSICFEFRYFLANTIMRDCNTNVTAFVIGQAKQPVRRDTEMRGESRQVL